MMQDPESERYGLELALQAGVEPGTIYPILVAFEGVGWLTSRQESDVDAHAEGRPSRRYYRLTAAGVAAVQEALLQRRRPAPGATRKLAW
jgi:DNA-binding PadR family transcriptional regulator